MNQDDLFSRLVSESQKFVGNLKCGLVLNEGDELRLMPLGLELLLIKSQEEVGAVHRPETDLFEVVRLGPESTRLCRVVEIRPLSGSVVFVLCE